MLSNVRQYFTVHNYFQLSTRKIFRMQMEIVLKFMSFENVNCSIRLKCIDTIFSICSIDIELQENLANVLCNINLFKCVCS